MPIPDFQSLMPPTMEVTADSAELMIEHDIGVSKVIRITSMKLRGADLTIDTRGERPGRAPGCSVRIGRRERQLDVSRRITDDST